MKVAFYAPMKAPTAPVPSGDRKIARLLWRALQEAGHDVGLASTFRSWDGRGDVARQRRLRGLGQRLAERLARRYRGEPPAARPAVWFSYHVYYKAPDWLGPAVSRALDIPYVIAEASYAPKHADGPWGMGLEAARAAITRCDRVIALKSCDIPCLLPLLGDRRRLVTLKPFLDTREYTVSDGRASARSVLRQCYGLDPARPWLLTVAMMREGNKLACYRVLAQALQGITERRLSLLIAGDGPTRAEVEAAFAPLRGHHIVFAGLQPPDVLRAFYAAADLFVWPAVDEPFGMALLEAQAAGLAVVAGRSRGVPDVVSDGVTGLLAPPGDAGAFAGAVLALLDSPARASAMGAAGADLACREHDIVGAAAALDRILEQARQRGRR